MSESKAPLYLVTVRDALVSIDAIEPGADRYAAAEESVIYRERDAIELHREATADSAASGSWSFASLENAKSFALLHMKTIEQRVADNLDWIQAYDG